MATDLTAAATETDANVSHPINTEAFSATTLIALFAQVMVNKILFWRRRIETVIGQLAPLGGLLPVAGSANAGTDAITIAGHGLSNADRVCLYATSGAALPGGLSASTLYFVINKTNDTIQLSPTSGGAAVDITDAGSGDWYVAKSPASSAILPLLAATANSFAGSITAATITSLGALSSGGACNVGGNLLVAGLLYELQPPIIVANADATITTAPKCYAVPDVTADRTITLANPVSSGQFGGRWTRIAGSSGFSVNFQRVSTVALATLQGNGSAGWVEFRAYDDGGGAGLAWHCVAWGGAQGATGGGVPYA
jgi:hypothetical protein